MPYARALKKAMKYGGQALKSFNKAINAAMPEFSKGFKKAAKKNKVKLK